MSAAWRAFAGTILVLLLSSTGTEARAQLLGDRVEATCGVAAGGDVADSSVTVVCGMPHETVAELVRLAASPDAGDRAALLTRLDALVPESSRLRTEAIARFFEILGEAPASETGLADRFAAIAEEHRRLLEDVRRLRVQDPEVQALREQAAAALELAEHDAARAKLEAARALVRSKREALAKVLAEQQREEAALVTEQAQIERARLRYVEAGQLFEEATQLLPAEDLETRWLYLLDAAGAWSSQGNEFGDNAALQRAIGLYKDATEFAPRSLRPFDWAMTQNDLGNALWILGARESGTARLEEAVAAYRAALEERARTRVPLDWAATQNNLANALWTLGARESDVGTLRQAQAALQASREVYVGDAGLTHYEDFFVQRIDALTELIAALEAE